MYPFCFNYLQAEVILLDNFIFVSLPSPANIALLFLKAPKSHCLPPSTAIRSSVRFNFTPSEAASSVGNTQQQTAGLLSTLFYRIHLSRLFVFIFPFNKSLNAELNTLANRGERYSTIRSRTPHNKDGTVPILKRR